MSIKVQDYGSKIVVTNPRNGQKTEMINVIFTEAERGGVNAHMSETSKFLSQLIGEEVGLSLIRSHTHPVLSSKIQFFPIGQEFPGHINRGLFSTPQMRQQKDVDPRVIDGRPTYFATWIGDKPEDDVDLRLSNDELAKSYPEMLKSANAGVSQVEVVQQKFSAQPIVAQG